MDEPTFNQLRTIEQLGYVVWARPISQRDINGAWMLVQSPEKGCAHIKESMNKHLENMRAKVAEMSDSDFKTQVEAVYTAVAEKDQNLNQENARHMVEITSHRY